MTSRFDFSVMSIALVAVFVSGCGWVRGLRRDLEDEDRTSSISTSDFDYYKDPANRFVPPPPATVRDARSAALAGSPVDLSGTRAKRMRVTAAEFVAENTKNENSLWAEEGQNNYFFAQNKLKMPGDLLTVVIEDPLRNDMVGSVKKLLPPEYADAEIRVPGLTKEKPEEDGRAPAAAGQEPPKADSGEPGPNDIMTAEVLERYPNGNLRIRGIKRVPFKRQVRNIEVLAIVKGADVNEKDMVKSSKFFEHKVELYR